MTVDHSVADRFLPKPCGGSNSKERLQKTAKQKRGPKPSSSQPEELQDPDDVDGLDPFTEDEDMYMKCYCCTLKCSHIIMHMNNRIYYIKNN